MANGKSAPKSTNILQTYVETLRKACQPDSTFEDKNEFLDIVYWLRQLVAVITGVIWGLIPLKGFIAIVLFFALNAFVVYLYSTVFHHIDEDEYGGFGEIIKEGLMTAFSCYMVSWIVVYDYKFGTSIGAASLS